MAGGKRNIDLETLILNNPGVSAAQLAKLSGKSKSRIIRLKNLLKRAQPEKFGLKKQEKRLPVDENSLSKVATEVLNDMTEDEREWFIGGIIKTLVQEKRLTLDDVEEMGLNF